MHSFISSTVLVLAIANVIVITGDAFSPSSMPAKRRVKIDYPVYPLAPLQTTSSSDAGVSNPLVAPEATKQRLDLLDDAIRSSFNSTSAAELMKELNDLRKSETDQSKIAAYLDELLAQGPDSDLPLWARKGPRWLTKCSRRARMASLQRTLDMTTPPPPAEDDETIMDTEEEKLRRRRRAFVALLQQLETTADDIEGKNVLAISYLEKQAKKELKANKKNENWIARRPEGLETPKYEVLVSRPEDNLEIRRYEPFAVCSVSMGKPRPSDSYRTDATVSDPKTSGARSFGALAGYLFGKNQMEKSMAMTTPVLTTQAEWQSLGSNDKEMSFVLPSEFWKEDGLESAPKPLEGSGVKLQRKDAGERAVIMFGGYASGKDTEEKKERLVKALARVDGWEPVDDYESTVTLSQYNDPFTPPWKRLNEVSISVRPRK